MVYLAYTCPPSLLLLTCCVSPSYPLQDLARMLGWVYDRHRHRAPSNGKLGELMDLVGSGPPCSQLAASLSRSRPAKPNQSRHHLPQALSPILCFGHPFRPLATPPTAIINHATSAPDHSTLPHKPGPITPPYRHCTMPPPRSCTH